MDFNNYLTVLNTISAIAIIVYVFFTYRAVVAMKDQTEAIYRPYISISHFLDEDTLVGLVIKNTGRTTASNVRLNIDKDFYQLGSADKDLNLRSIYLFSNEIKSMSPDATLLLSLAPTILLINASENDSITPLVFNITATYSYGKKTFTEVTAIDLRVYRNTFLPVGSVEKQLLKINKSLQHLLLLLEKK